MSDHETVYVVVRKQGGLTGYYHTDPDCRNLHKALDFTEKPLDVLPDELEHCKICEGTATFGRNGGPQLRKKLEEMDPEDLGLSPLRGEKA